MTKSRALFIIVAVLLIGLVAGRSDTLARPESRAQADTAAQIDKNAQQQSKPGLEPLLGQLTSKNCPALSQAEIQQAIANIKDSKREIPKALQDLLEAWLAYSKYYKHMHYTVSIAIIVFGALATALKDQEIWWGRWKTMAALLATVAAGVSRTTRSSTKHSLFSIQRKPLT